MNGKVLCGCAAIALLAVVGCSTTAEATVAEGGEPVAAVEAAKEKQVEYFPLVPEVRWENLNWLQKTTAGIAIVPGCVLSALANAVQWCTNGALQ